MWAIEAELTPKPLARTVTIMRGLLARTSDYGPSVTDATPQAIRDLLTDPRADHNTPRPSQPGTTGQDHVSHLTGHTGSSSRVNTAEGLPAGAGSPSHWQPGYRL